MPTHASSTTTHGSSSTKTNISLLRSSAMRQFRKLPRDMQDNVAESAASLAPHPSGTTAKRLATRVVHQLASLTPQMKQEHVRDVISKVFAMALNVGYATALSGAILAAMYKAPWHFVSTLGSTVYASVLAAAGGTNRAALATATASKSLLQALVWSSLGMISYGRLKTNVLGLGDVPQQFVFDIRLSTDEKKKIRLHESDAPHRGENSGHARYPATNADVVRRPSTTHHRKRRRSRARHQTVRVVQRRPARRVSRKKTQ